MNCGVFFSNLWNFFHCPEISRTEKILVPVLTLIYWVWPLDLLPGLLIDDLGVTGIAMAYMNWRVMQAQKNTQTQTATAETSSEESRPEPEQKYLPQTTTENSSALPESFFQRKK